MPEVDALTADEVAQMLRVSRNTVYNLVKRDELASYYVGRKMRFARADVENYIARTASMPASMRADAAGRPTSAAPAPGEAPLAARDGARAQQAAAGGVATAPRSAQGGDGRPGGGPYVIAGNDILGDLIANYLGATSRIPFERVYEGSHAALVDLFGGRAHAALTHLRDASGAYNVPFVERILPGMPVRLVRLVGRRQGLIVAKGNPKELRTWADLGREGVRIANRERGCGSRVLLDEMLAEHGIDRRALAGYDRAHASALTTAALVVRGAADACVGSERTFHQVEGVDFLPLQVEWLDVALSLETEACSRVADAVCRLVNARPFREDVGRLVGYDISRMGEVVFERRA